MYTLSAQDFSEKNGFVMHTGMRSFDTPLRWQASEAEEGVLIASDGVVTAVMPGSELRLDARNTGLQYDLFVFNRKGTLTGHVGVGGIIGPDGKVYGGFGEFRCTLLMPRRCLPLVRDALGSGVPIVQPAAELIRPAMRKAVESVLTRGGASIEPAALRARVEHAALKPMNDLLIPFGLQLESLHIEWIGQTEEHHEKRR